MRYLLQAGLMALLALVLISPATYAAADWEWSRDKGWTQGAGTPKDTPGEQLRSAYDLEKSGRYMNAATEYFLLLKTYPDSQEAGIALQRLAACLFQMEDYYDAFNALQQVIKSYKMSAKKSDLIKIEFLIGRKFQEGARKDLLNDNEPAAVGKQAAIDIFKAVIENDPVGPYAGAATLAIAACYKDLNNPHEGIAYADRVVNEFGQSVELVAKARILKKQMEVMLGKASVQDVKKEIETASNLLKDEGNSAASGAGDFAAATDFDEEIRELEEAQAAKLWEAADFYKRRGSRESITAYKFSLEQLVIRFPNTTYADKARRVVGKVRIPPPENPFGKLNIPFMSEKKEASFVVAPNSPSHVDTIPVSVPGTPGGEDMPGADGSVARVKPAAPPQRNTHTPMAEARPVATPVNAGTPPVPSENDGAPVTESANEGAIAVTGSTPPEAPRAKPPAEKRGKPVAYRSTPPGMSSSSASPSALRPVAKRPAVAVREAAPVSFAPTKPVDNNIEEGSRGVRVERSSVVSRMPTGGYVGSGRSSVPPSERVASSTVPAAMRPQRTVSSPAANSAPISSSASVVRESKATPRVPSLPGEDRETASRYSDGPVTTPASTQPVAVTRSNLELPPLPEGSTEEVKVIREAASKATSTANEAAAGGNKWEFSEDFE